jgi:lipopolysaccharide/colanic/teichoic acid biosynthesis glycosyltransferase
VNLDAGLLIGLIGVAALVIGGELLLRGIARKPYKRGTYGRQPAFTASQAQRMFGRVVYQLAPGTVGGAICAVRTEDPTLGFLVFLAMVGACTLMWPARSALRLMPMARVVVRFLLPTVGLGLMLLPGLVQPWPLDFDTALPSLLGAWLITAFGTWIEASFDAERPIRTAVIGSSSLAKKLAAEMRQMKVRDYVVVGYVWPDQDFEPDVDPDHVLPWLGELEEMRDVVQIFGIDLIVVGPDSPRLQVFEQTANACLDLPVRMMEASALYEDVLGHVPIGQINSAWFQCIMHPRYSPTSPFSKRLLDVTIAVVLGLLTLPLLPLAALLIWLPDRGPVFYRQPRVGEQGREFQIFKLRTMRTDAFELAGLVPKEELITRLGRILRKTHLDELPQLWNVLKGDMTLVGPRPEQPQLVEGLAKVVPYYERRSLVKPGVTGWAQVRCGYAGTQVGTAWKICHDLYYVKRRSLLFDILIMIQTLQGLGEMADTELEAPSEDFILGEAATLVHN